MAGTVVASTINNDTGLFSTNNAYLGIAKAWVNYNAVSKTIINSFNISSITYNSTGNYTVNFATAMPNANYIMSGIGSFADGTNNSDVLVVGPYRGSSTPFSTTTAGIIATFRTANNSTFADGALTCIAFFGN